MTHLKPKQPTLGSSSMIKISKQQILSSTKLIALGLLESLVGLAYICAKHTRRACRRLQAACSRRLLSYKAMRKCSHRNDNDDDDNSALWQRTILMGDKCQPLDFSGVIYYDADGNRLPEPPKSPRNKDDYATAGSSGGGGSGLFSPPELE
ncbi:hypothetical protein Ancab_038744 [Ancistrocladus abbreviatus]